MPAHADVGLLQTIKVNLTGRPGEQNNCSRCNNSPIHKTALQPLMSSAVTHFTDAAFVVPYKQQRQTKVS